MFSLYDSIPTEKRLQPKPYFKSGKNKRTKPRKKGRK